MNWQVDDAEMLRLIKKRCQSVIDNFGDLANPAKEVALAVQMLCNLIEERTKEETC